MMWYKTYHQDEPRTSTTVLWTTRNLVMKDDTSKQLAFIKFRFYSAKNAKIGTVNFTFSCRCYHGSVWQLENSATINPIIETFKGTLDVCGFPEIGLHPRLPEKSTQIKLTRVHHISLSTYLTINLSVMEESSVARAFTFMRLQKNSRNLCVARPYVLQD